ncbi:hypothetical protein CASFOL_006114 [Castilleja foliolosa]|uniref:Uncharacterized protein n=1 Tax=Castilleja foliolosa TaxID=1961234 RepID=A0ABD3E6F0_9LAMI
MDRPLFIHRGITGDDKYNWSFRVEGILRETALRSVDFKPTISWRFQPKAIE